MGYQACYSVFPHFAFPLQALFPAEPRFTSIATKWLSRFMNDVAEGIAERSKPWNSPTSVVS
jgi:hypothetical protein